MALLLQPQAPDPAIDRLEHARGSLHKDTRQNWARRWLPG
jgi:hypothetical protein